MGRTLTINVATREEFTDTILRSLRDGKSRAPHYTFATASDFLETMTRNRILLLRALSGQAPMSTREIARRLGRDVHAVHNDVHALINCGLLRKSEHGIAFPFDAVRLDVTFTGADPVTPPRRRRRRDPEAA